MAHAGRRPADDALAAALAVGRSVRAAAVAAGVSERTAGRRLADPAFKARVQDLRGVMVSAAAGRLAATLGRAVRVLADLLRSRDPHVRYKAAAKLAELTLKVREQDELADRVAELERRLADGRPPVPDDGTDDEADDGVADDETDPPPATPAGGPEGEDER